MRALRTTIIVLAIIWWGFGIAIISI